MSSPANKLVEHWTLRGLGIADGNSESVVRAFELKHGVILPVDFREYLLSVDGMMQLHGHDCDPLWFAFWPLDRIRNAQEECSKPRMSLPKVANLANYFVFADYLQWCWAYAIRLSGDRSDRNPVFAIGSLNDGEIASSFSDFVDLYISDAKQLYPS